MASGAITSPQHLSQWARSSTESCRQAREVYGWIFQVPLNLLRMAHPQAGRPVTPDAFGMLAAGFRCGVLAAGGDGYGSSRHFQDRDIHEDPQIHHRPADPALDSIPAERCLDFPQFIYGLKLPGAAPSRVQRR
jgi:hypothetical protein